MGSTPTTDPVLARRHAIARLTTLGTRVGYACFAAAVVLFVVGFVVGFDSTIVGVVVGLMAVGSVVLAPSIVFSYAVRAAEREDRGEPSGH